MGTSILETNVIALVQASAARSSLLPRARAANVIIASSAALYGFRRGVIVVCRFLSDRSLAERINHSEPTGLPFSATERFINNTANATQNVSTAIIQKVSK